MARDRWTRWPHHANRVKPRYFVGLTNSLAHHAVFDAGVDGPTTYNYNPNSATFHGFVGSAGLNFNPLERAYTWATSPEFHGFVGSAGVNFVENYQYTAITSPEFHGFVGSAGLNFNPLERAYTAVASPEFHGFVGTAGVFDPLERAYTWATSPEFHGFVGGEIYEYVPLDEGSPTTYTWATSPEFHGFVGSAGLNFNPLERAYTAVASPEFHGFVGSAAHAHLGDPLTVTWSGSSEMHGFAGAAIIAFAPYVEAKRRRRTGYIEWLEKQKPEQLEQPTTYNAPLPDGGFARLGGGGGGLLIRKKLPYNTLAIVLGGH